MGVIYVLDGSDGTERPSASSRDDDDLVSENRKAASIMFRGLGDNPLRIVVNMRKDPSVLNTNLNERYWSTNFFTHMSLMSTLSSKTFKGRDISEYV